MYQEELLEDDDATLDAPLHWLVISDQVVKGLNQLSLVVLWRINQLTVARRLNMCGVSMHIAHVFLETLGGANLSLPIHVPEVDTTAMDHLHVLLVSFFIVEPYQWVALRTIVFDLWIVLFILQKLHAEPPLLIFLHLCVQEFFLFNVFLSLLRLPLSLLCFLLGARLCLRKFFRLLNGLLR